MLLQQNVQFAPIHCKNLMTADADRTAGSMAAFTSKYPDRHPLEIMPLSSCCLACRIRVLDWRRRGLQLPFGSPDTSSCVVFDCCDSYVISDLDRCIDS